MPEPTQQVIDAPETGTGPLPLTAPRPLTQEAPPEPEAQLSEANPWEEIPSLLESDPDAAFQKYWEVAETHEGLKKARDAHLETERAKVHKETYAEAHDYFRDTYATIARQVENQQQLLEAVLPFQEQVNQGLASINGRLRKAIEDGSITEEGVVDILKSDGRIWPILDGMVKLRQLQEQRQAWGNETNLKAAVAQAAGPAQYQGIWQGISTTFYEGLVAIGHPELFGESFQPKINAGYASRDGTAMIDTMRSLMKEVYALGKADGAIEGRKEAGQGLSEAEKVIARTGQRPDLATRVANKGSFPAPRTQREAAVLHAQGRISNAQMREYNRTLPE